MQRYFSLFILPALILLPFFFWFKSAPLKDTESDMFEPSEWFHFQRAYPYADIPYNKYQDGIQAGNLLKRESMAKTQPQWIPAGPANIGGRITALEADPANPSTVYIGGAVGGILKTTDSGDTWTTLTDFFPGLSVGALVMDPLNSQVLYCGTGEANISTDSYAGFGIIKTTNGGQSWFKCGLDSVRHIAEIRIHPLNNRSIFAAASGGLYSKGPHRGVYRSMDAGATWHKVLYINDSTSAVDIALDPTDTSRVYAAVWDRLRGPTFRKAVGINSAIYYSTNGGWNWSRMTNGLPSTDPLTGRISIAVAPSNSNYVYALYKSAYNGNTSTNGFYGFYRSTNKGLSWSRMPDGPLPSEFSNFGWYFGLLKVDPVDYQKVYIGEVDLYRSTDAGNSWTNITNSYSGSFEQQHPDMHALWINPSNTNILYNGNDGGYFTSVNSGLTWTKKHNLPISQFYGAAIDYLLPERLYGGTQDNGSIGTQTGQIDDWSLYWYGDGFICQVDYSNSNIIYAESQNGGIVRSTNGGAGFTTIQSGIDMSRTNWCTPFIIDPQTPSILYFGTYRLHKSTNRGDSWTAISPDLTRGINGRLGTITAIAAAPSTTASQVVLYTATDDAKLSVSTNSGTTWTDRTGPLPNRYMTDVVADKRNPQTAYVSLSGYNLDEPMAHIYRTTDYGQSWLKISSNLPDVPVNSLIIDYNYDSVLYAGTDLGVFYTTNLGRSWSVLGQGLPNCPVFDLVYHQGTRQLVAATHGRSMFRIDLTAAISAVEPNVQQPYVFSLLPAWPNPFNPETNISFSLPSAGQVKLEIYDMAGRVVKVLTDRNCGPGAQSYKFNGSTLSSGVYIAAITYNGQCKCQKIALLK